MKKESDFLIKNHLLYLYLSAHYTHCAVILYANIIKRTQITTVYANTNNAPSL